MWNYAALLGDGVAGIFLVAYLTRHLPMTAYGVLLFALSCGAIPYLFDLGLGNLLVQAYIAHKPDMQRVNRLLSTACLVLAGVGIASLAVFALIAAFLPGPFNLPAEYVPQARLIFMLVAGSAALGLVTIPLELIFQAFHRFDRLSQLRLLVLLPYLVLSIAAVAFGYGIVGLALAGLLVAGLRFLVLVFALGVAVPGARFEPWRFDAALLRSVIQPGGWVVADNVCRQLATLSDSLFLAIFLPMRAMAVFAVASKLPARLTDVVWRGTVAVFPPLAEHHTQGDTRLLKQLYLNTLRTLFTGFLPILVLGTVCAASLIRLWAGTKYDDAAPVMHWLLLAIFSLAFEFPSDLLLYATGRPKQAASIAIAETFAKVVVSLMLLLRFGVVGLAAGTALTHLLINLFWYTPTACRAADVSARELFQHLTRGLGPMLAFLSVATLLVGLLGSTLSPAAHVGAGVIAGMLYVMLWVAAVARPLWRGEAHASA